MFRACGMLRRNGVYSALILHDTDQEEKVVHNMY